MWELREGNLIRYECHVGHRYMVESLLSEQNESVESALWSAIRILEERASLLTRMSNEAVQKGHKYASRRMTTRAEETHQSAEIIRRLVENLQLNNPENDLSDDPAAYQDQDPAHAA